MALPFIWDGGAGSAVRGLLGPQSKPTTPGQLQHRYLQGQQICCSVVYSRFAASGCSGSLRQSNLLITDVPKAGAGGAEGGLDSKQCWGGSSAAVLLQRCGWVLLFSCWQPLASRSMHTCFPLEITGVNSADAWPETKRFRALSKEFKTPPKFAENTYQMGGSQTASV